MAFVGGEGAVALSQRDKVTATARRRSSDGGGIMERLEQENETRFHSSDADMYTKLGIKHDDFDEFGHEIRRVHMRRHVIAGKVSRRECESAAWLATLLTRPFPNNQEPRRRFRSDQRF